MAFENLIHRNNYYGIGAMEIYLSILVYIHRFSTIHTSIGFYSGRNIDICTYITLPLGQFYFSTVY